MNKEIINKLTIRIQDYWDSDKREYRKKTIFCDTKCFTKENLLQRKIDFETHYDKNSQFEYNTCTGILFKDRLPILHFDSKAGLPSKWAQQNIIYIINCTIKDKLLVG